MRKLFFLFPELNIRQGGHSAQMAFMDISNDFCSATAVTYKKSTEGTLHLDQVLQDDSDHLKDCMFVVHWGPDVGMLAKRLKGHAIVYLAHSTGWGFNLPTGIPILAVSRHTQSYWATRAPRNPVFYLPNVIDDKFHNSEAPRDTDVLVMKRKTSDYVLNQLLPALSPECKVQLIEGWVDDVAVEMRTSKIFLYDSTDHWREQGVSEGFGLPPLEALACGCQVFSSLNHALSDYLDPDVNCQQLGVHSIEFDKYRILRALEQWTPEKTINSVADAYRREKIATRMGRILTTVNEFFDVLENTDGSAQPGKWSTLFKR